MAARPRFRAVTLPGFQGRAFAVTIYDRQGIIARAVEALGKSTFPLRDLEQDDGGFVLELLVDLGLLTQIGHASGRDLYSTHLFLLQSDARIVDPDQITLAVKQSALNLLGLTGREIDHTVAVLIPASNLTRDNPARGLPAMAGRRRLR